MVCQTINICLYEVHYIMKIMPGKIKNSMPKNQNIICLKISKIFSIIVGRFFYQNIFKGNN